MPGNEQLGSQPPTPDSNPDLLKDAAAGYDPVAEAEAATGDAQAGGGEPGEPEAGPDAFQAADASGPSRLMGALRTAGNAMGEAARWTTPVVGTALKEETGMDVYRFAGEQPELNEDQQFAAGVARWAIRRGMEHLAERQASGA